MLQSNQCGSKICSGMRKSAFMIVVNQSGIKNWTLQALGTWHLDSRSNFYPFQLFMSFNYSLFRM